MVAFCFCYNADMKNALILVVVLFIFLTGVYWYNNRPIAPPPSPALNTKYGTDPKNATYTIDGREYSLVYGTAEEAVAPDSASMIVTQYFGNEVYTDLNEDGREDVVFLLTQELGGTGTFYYAVAALNTEKGYVGSKAFLLGDRIAPQATTLGQQGVIVVNYADRTPGEPMTSVPSQGVSKYLRYDSAENALVETSR